MLPDFLTRLLLALMALVMRLYVYPTAKLAGYQKFEPERDSILVTCCTNGLGHVHQMERVLTVLQEAGLKFPIVALAKEQKVPAYKLAALKEKFPDTSFVNLNFEVDYDNGKSFNNRQVVWSATKQVFTSSPFRKVCRLMRRHRPAYCLSFWEPAVSSFINVMNAPTKVVSVASQGQIYADDGAGSKTKQSLLMRALHELNVGKSGTLVPLSVKRIDGAIPQVVKLPPLPPPDAEVEDFYVAYSTVPQVLAPVSWKLPNKRVLLFVKEKRLAFYTKAYRKFKNIEVRETSSDFADYLARSKGLIASPSRGVVTQAIALGKPVYLFCPKGHLEQEYNLRFYLQSFEGISCPRSRRYRRYVHASRTGDLEEGWKGRMQTVAEWANATEGVDLREQALALREWLDQIDTLIAARLVPLLQPSSEELAREAERIAAEEEEERRELAAAVKTTDVDVEEGDPELVQELAQEEDPDEVEEELEEVAAEQQESPP
ncbi:hypothetical protein AB1Y20_005424 [Prymnesium parvum]|uniref:Uncharacterized protein n=1 Tax=Prymnesium parvum TaxID=97485 RepID=A0AB34J5Y3_PRYPA